MKSKERMKVISATFPMEELECDLVNLSAFTSKNNGYKYLLTVVCVMSKFAWAIPLITKTADEVGDALFHLLLIFGVPLTMRCDNGGEFSGLFQIVLTKLKVNIKYVYYCICRPTNYSRQ